MRREPSRRRMVIGPEGSTLTISAIMTSSVVPPAVGAASAEGIGVFAGIVLSARIGESAWIAVGAGAREGLSRR